MDTLELKTADVQRLINDFEQAKDQIEALEKSNDLLWKVLQFLMENIDGKR